MSKIAGDPNARLMQVVENLERRVRQLERTKTLVFRGARTDDPDGDGSQVGTRCVIGEQGDGTWGVRVWSVAGSVVINQTA